MTQSNYRAKISSKTHQLVNHLYKLLNNLILIVDGDYPHGDGAHIAPARCRSNVTAAAAGSQPDTLGFQTLASAPLRRPVPLSSLLRR